MQPKEMPTTLHLSADEIDLIVAFKQAQESYIAGFRAMGKAPDYLTADDVETLRAATDEAAYGLAQALANHVPCPIQGNSPDESEVPDTPATTPNVRDILDQIHTAARDYRHQVPGARDAHYILGYIQRKEAEVNAMKVKHRIGYQRTFNHIHAVVISTEEVSKRLRKIERIAANALALPSQVVHS